MLDTKDIGNVADVTQADKDIEVEPPEVLAIAFNDQVLGGAIVSNKSLINCWSVSDLVVDHWARLIATKQVHLISVAEGTSRAVRSTLDRYHADGIQRIRTEADKRQGTLDAVQHITTALLPNREEGRTWLD